MVDLRFKLVNPIYLLLMSLALLLFLIILAPVNYEYSASLFSWSFFLVSVVSIFLGYFTTNVKVSGRQVIRMKADIVKINKAFWIVMFLSTVGFLLQAIDIFLLRGASIDNDFFENREVLQQNSGGLTSFVSAFLYPAFLALPFFYMLRRKCHKKSKILFLVVAFLLLSELFISLLFGSRILVLIVVVMLFLYAYSLGIIRFRYRDVFFLILLVLGLVYFSGVVFIDRTTLFGLDPLLSTQVSGYATWVPLSSEAYQFVDSFRQAPPAFNLLIGFITLRQYFLHPVFELLDLVDNFDIQNVLCGKETFSVYVKAIDFLTGFSFSNSHVILREGVYTTLWGNLYYDFGYLGFIISFLIGTFLGFVTKLRSFSLILLLPLFFYLSLVVAFSPFMNLITYGKGMYFISTFLMIFLLFKLSEVRVKK